MGHRPDRWAAGLGDRAGPTIDAVLRAAVLLAGFAGALGGQEPVGIEARGPVPGQPYEGFVVVDSLQRGVQAYLSEHRSDIRLPLVVYVQGSGAGSLFRLRPSGQVAGAFGHATVRDVFSSDAYVLLVEKPGVAYLDGDTPVADAREEFRREHTLDRWVVALEAAMDQACVAEYVACETGVVVIGHSEGGVVAARLAARSSRVTHAALLSGEGPTQLYSLLALARAGEFFLHAGETGDERVRFLLREWERVLDDPTATDRFFFGHPYRRWASFLSASPMEELRGAGARIFLAQGTADRAVAPESAEVLFASLAAAGKDVCYLRAEGADHSFHTPGGDGWPAVLRAVREWVAGSDFGGAAIICAREGR